MNHTPADILNFLAAIPDPEVPVISIVELGIVRNVAIFDGTVKVTITPTYSGCPAMKLIEDEITAVLKSNGYATKIETVFSPAWTTDWLSAEAKEKLKNYGIAPPGEREQDLLVTFPKKRSVPCPRCNGTKTELKSEFGATACKALYYCSSCCEPFEHFKAH